MAAVAAAQRGLITAAQLTELGCSPGRRESWLRSGRLHRVFHGVYVVGRPMLSREGRWLAAVLACGPGAALSHLCAGAHWGILRAPGETIEVTAPRSRASRPGLTVHRRRTPPRVTVHCGIPVTTLEQTLEDLARTFAPEALRQAVGEAELRPEFDPAVLPERVWARIGADAKSGVDANVLQDRFLALCRRAGLPTPERDVPWGRWEIDFLWREQGVAVETDGRSVHARRSQFSRDRAKDRELQLGGLLALRFTYREVTRQTAMVAETCRTALGGLGKPAL